MIDTWPDCPVPGCTNKICLALNSDKCFPHTPGNHHIKRWKIALRNDLPIDNLTTPTRTEGTEKGQSSHVRR